MSTLAKQEQFQVQIGDTERNIEEIIDSIRKSDLPITQIKQTSASPNQTGRGATLTLQTASDTLSQEDVKRQLNEQGGCMYQIESVTKSTK